MYENYMALLNNTFYPLVVLYMHTNKLQQMVRRFQIKMSSAIMRRVKFPLGTGGKIQMLILLVNPHYSSVHIFCMCT